jgi:hypothetical protein
MVIEAVNPTFAGQCPFGSGRCTFLTPFVNESSTWGLLRTKAAGSDRRDQQIVALAARDAIPDMYTNRELAANG